MQIFTRMNNVLLPPCDFFSPQNVLIYLETQTVSHERCGTRSLLKPLKDVKSEIKLVPLVIVTHTQRHWDNSFPFVQVI